MSYNAVHSSFSRIRALISEREFQVPYLFIDKTIDGVRSLFNDWLDIYVEYNKGYSQMVLRYVDLPVRRLLSSYGVNLWRKFEEIFSAKIPPEVYILLRNTLDNLGYPYTTFVFAAGDSFEQTTIHQEVVKALDGLSVPGPQEASAQIQVLKTGIRKKDICVLYYESGQYNNPFTWPLLLHEILHFVYDREGLNRLEDRCPKVSWVQETIIDTYAMLFFGPAFAASSAVYLERFPHPKALSHPDFISRVYLSLLYLTDLIEDSEELPTPLAKQVDETFGYVETVWKRYKAKSPGIQENVEKIFSATKQRMIENLSRKTKTFVDFVISKREERSEAFKASPEDYIEKEVLSIDDIQEHYKHGIPVAASPRILFNSFVSKRFLEEEKIVNKFITLSLKRWYLKNQWNQTALQLET